jgi:hypothetical protein
MIDHVKSRGFWFLLLCSSWMFGGSKPGVDLMDHVKSRRFWFFLLQSSRTFGGSELVVGLKDHSFKGFCFFYFAVHGSLGVPDRVST